MKMNLKPSLRFQLADLLKSSIGFFASIVIVALLVPLLRMMLGGRGEVSFGGYVIIAAIYLFVVGIVAPRSYLRLDMQLGISRATSFTATLVSVLLVSLTLSLAGELLSAVTQLLTARDSMYLVDMYQMIYNDGAALSFGGHLVSIGFNTCICIFSYFSGMFYTLLFWRLNKLWTVVAALAIVVFANLLLNADTFVPEVSRLAVLADRFINAASESPLPLMVLFLVLSAVLALIEWLLVRGAYIRASAG